MSRLKQILRWVLVLHAVAGALALVRILLGPPMVLGAGSIDALEQTLERFDFKALVFALLLLFWLLPLLVALAWRRASAAGLEAQRLSVLVEGLLANRVLPVEVEVEGRVPVRLDGPIRLPVHLRTRVDLDEEIEVEARVPVQAEIPFETEIETSVLGLGNVRVPVRALVPIDVILPVKGRVRVKAQVPVSLDEEVEVEVPPMEVPVSSRLQTRVDLLSSLKQAEERRRRRKEGGEITPAPPAQESSG